MQKIKINSKYKQRLINNVYLKQTDSLTNRQIRLEKLSNEAYDHGSQNVENLFKNANNLKIQNKKLSFQLQQLKLIIQNYELNTNNQINQLRTIILCKQQQIKNLTQKVQILQKQLNKNQNQKSIINHLNPQFKRIDENKQITDKKFYWEENNLSQSKLQNVKGQSLLQQFRNEKIVISEIVNSNSFSKEHKSPYNNNIMNDYKHTSPVKFIFQNNFHYPQNSSIVNNSNNHINNLNNNHIKNPNNLFFSSTPPPPKLNNSSFKIPLIASLNKNTEQRIHPSELNTIIQNNSSNRGLSLVYDKRS